MNNVCETHRAYDSAHLAGNAVLLHQMLLVHCTGFHYWACGDHFHCGHEYANQSRSCKTNPAHIASEQRREDRILSRRRISGGRA